jgi:ketosteroid isomerase-like protein
MSDLAKISGGWRDSFDAVGGDLVAAGAVLCHTPARMGRWGRDELEEAFDHYRRTALEAGTSGDWNAWADLFTEDATYVEHNFGTFGGREAIRGWITATMASFPGNQMPQYPIEWYVIDDERGWIVCQVWNRMVDPGDGSLHQAYNFTLLKYAGNGKWSYEEDIYNPEAFARMIEGWTAAKKQVDAAGQRQE